jgi:hypothetical protein
MAVRLERAAELELVIIFTCSLEENMSIRSIDEFQHVLEDELNASRLPDHVVRAAMSYYQGELIQERASGSFQAHFRFPFQEHGYVVRRDDVSLLSNSVGWVFAAATLGLGVLGPTTVALASVGLGVAQIAFRVYETLDKFRRKAALVTPHQYAVIGAMKAIDAPVTVEQIRDVLEKKGQNVNVGAILEELAQLRSHDNTVRGFVEQDKEGRWFLVGI